MIYIVEIPHQMPSRCWSANDKDDLLNALISAHSGASEVVWEKSTPHEQMEICGYDSPEDAENDPDGSMVCQLVAQHGLDAEIYQTNETWRYVEGIEGWVTEPQGELEAYLDYNAHDLSSQRVYWSDEEALKAYHTESTWTCHQGYAARANLYQELADNDVCPELVEVKDKVGGV